jgi:WD40 repeat protein
VGRPDRARTVPVLSFASRWVRETAERIAAHFTTDGTRILTLSIDATARIWDTATGKELAQLHHNASVLSGELRGDRLATGSLDHIARVWNIRSLMLHNNDLIASVCVQRPTATLRLTPEDVAIAPLLSGRVRDDVCRE